MSERAAKSNRGHGVDRLSALPDALIHCVMSYLTARQAVRTCTLSWRWRNLWRSLPSLDVDSKNMDKKKPKFGADARPVLREMRWEEFKDFANVVKKKDFATKLLWHHSAPILDRFRLRVSTYRHEQADVREHVGRWILRGASYRPATLEISLESAAAYVRMPPPGITSSRLTRLCLSGVLIDGGFADYLRTGCPVLQDLEIKDCALDNFEEIVSGTLKRLTFYGCIAKRRLNADWCVRVRARASCTLPMAMAGGT